MPYARDQQLRGLSDQERTAYADAHTSFSDTFRGWELSADELSGFMAGYFMVHKLAGEGSPLRPVVAQRLAHVGSYLATFGYMLGRPGGGFTARGASGISVALEYPFSRAFLAICGREFPGADFDTACKAAGVWPALRSAISSGGVWGTVLSIAVILRMPVVALGGVGLGVLLGAKYPLTGGTLLRIRAVMQQSDCFDVSNDEMASEFATSAALLQAPPAYRYDRWLTVGGCVGGGYAMNFPPFIGLLGLDDEDSTVRDVYVDWYHRRRRTSMDVDYEPPRSRSCFAAAVAAILTGDADDEARLVECLEQAHATLLVEGVALDDHSHEEAPYIREKWALPLDYCGAVALAWLHAKRSADRGRPVTTPRFPVAPERAMPEPVIPREIVDHDPTIGEIPWDALKVHGNLPKNPNGDLRLYSDPASAQRPAEGSCTVPAAGDAFEDFGPYLISSREWDAATEVSLSLGDDFEITAEGAVGGWGPNGDGQITWDRSYPLHGLIDDANAHPHAVLGRLNNYFFVGSHRARARWLYGTQETATRLYLRVNEPEPTSAGGEFRVRVRVWRAKPTATLTALLTVIMGPPGPPPGIPRQARVVSHPPGIDCTGGTCRANFPAGTVVHLTAEAEAPALFQSWEGRCKRPGPGTCLVTIDRDQTITANFGEAL
jgi:hypothetical protein